MRSVVQRVLSASVASAGEQLASIGPGLLVLVAVHTDDTIEAADAHARKLLALRIFEDAGGRMSRSVVDAGGDILCVSNFTVYADTRRGSRPSFTAAARPDQAEPAYERLREALGARGGRFGAHMAVELVNDGPVTVVVET